MKPFFAKPSQRFWTVVAGCIAFCVPLFVFYPVLLQGRSLSTAREVPGIEGTDPPLANRPVVRDGYRIDPGASAFQFEPWAKITSREVHEHSMPLWNPYQAGGTPLAANLQSGGFDPLLLPLNVHSTPRIWDLTLLGTFCLGSLFMFLFLTQIGLRPLASLLGSVTFFWSAVFALSSNNSFIRGYIYLPMLLFLIERVTTRRTWLSVSLFALAVAGSFLVGMPETTFCVWLVVGPYAIFRIFADRPQWRRNTIRLATGGGLGILICLPLLWLFRQYSSLSWNAHSGNVGIGIRYEQTRSLLLILSPLLNGKPLSGVVDWIPATSRAWVGGGAVLLAILGFAASRNPLRSRQIFFGVTTICVVWKLYGFPGFEHISRLPGFDVLNAPSFLSQLIPFCIAVLAAITADCLANPAVTINWRRFWILLVVSLGGFSYLLWNIRPVLRAITGEYATFYLGLIVLTGLVVLAAFFLPWKQWRAPLTFIAVAVELWTLFPQYVLQYRYDPFATPKWVEAIRADAQKVPSAGGPFITDRVFGLDYKLYPNTAGAEGLPDIRSLDGLYIQRYMDYVRNFIDPGVYDRFTGMDDKHGRILVTYRNNPMFNLLGTKYIATGATNPSSFTTDFTSALPFNKVLNISTFDENGDRRRVIFQHGGAPGVDLPTVPSDAHYLAFSFALDPHAFESKAGDGVHFSIRDKSTGKELWAADVASATSNPQWYQPEVAVQPGQQLQLVVDPRLTNENDGAGWADLRFLNSNSQPVDTQYELFAKDGFTSVYKNTHADSRAFLVSSVVNVPNKKGSIDWLRSKSQHEASGLYSVNKIDPRKTVVAENTKSKISSCDNPGTAGLTRYGFSRVELQVDAQCPSFLVLTDSYFPGWKASVNGKSTKVLPTDLLFRGVQVPKGKSKVVFSYSPPGFNFTLLISILAIGGVIGLGGVSATRMLLLFWRRRKVQA